MVNRSYSNNDMGKLFLKTLFYITIADSDVNASWDYFEVIVMSVLCSVCLKSCIFSEQFKLKIPIS